MPLDPPIPSKLLGEAPPGDCVVRDGNGVVREPDYVIFPIVRYDDNSHVFLVGTGFFITTNGLFVTARHVLMDTLDANGRERFPIGILQMLPDNIYIHRPILRCAAHPVADIAVGVAAPMNRNSDGQPLTNRIVRLTLEGAAAGARVVTYAYPKHVNVIDGKLQTIHFMPTYYDGFIENFLPQGRDRVLLPGPCYQTSMVIHGGASGGPVFAPDGHVFGVNSTGYENDTLSFVSRINEILDLVIDDVSIDGGSPRSVPVREMAQKGHVVFKQRT